MEYTDTTIRDKHILELIENGHDVDSITHLFYCNISKVKEILEQHQKTTSKDNDIRLYIIHYLYTHGYDTSTKVGKVLNRCSSTVRAIYSYEDVEHKLQYDKSFIKNIEKIKKILPI